MKKDKDSSKTPISIRNLSRPIKSKENNKRKIFKLNKYSVKFM